MNVHVTATVTRVKDQVGITAVRKSIYNINKKLKKYDGLTIRLDDDLCQIYLMKAKEFVDLMKKRSMLGYTLSDMLETNESFHIKLNGDKYVIPTGIEEFTISEGPHNAECYKVTYPKGLNGIAKDISASRILWGHIRHILVRSTHPDCKFCMIIHPNGTDNFKVEMYPI